MADALYDDVLASPSLDQPTTLEEALSLLEQYGDEAKILAGGQSLLVLLRLGLVAPDRLISLKRIPELSAISEDEDDGLTIGAMVTQVELARNETIRTRYPALAEAAQAVASPAVRRLGSLGGNLCHADPTGDPPAALTALGATLTIASTAGTRQVPLEDFFVDYMETAIEPHELLTEVRLPARAAGSGSAYLKHHVRSIDTALVGAGVRIDLDDDGRTCREAAIGLVGVGITPIRARAAESALRGRVPDETALREAGEMAAGECEPLDDLEGSAWYRREMVKVLVQRVGAIARSRAHA
jgi:aerobic carbon-monoxide dehydrogenase medium subunit